MAAIFNDFVDPGVLTIPAAPDKLIRVRRILFSSDVNGRLDLFTDYGGSDTRITAPLFSRQGGQATLDQHFDVECPTGQRGFNVAAVTTGDGPHSVYLEYDVVD